MSHYGSQQTLADVERDHILETLAQCDGNRTHTAKLLDISVRSLRMKLHHYAEEGVSVPPPAKNEDAEVGAGIFGNSSQH